MNRRELQHAIRAACDVANDAELWVFGSQAILGEFPDPPESLRQSVEVDIAPRNHPERADAIDAMLGELSQFHQTHGFYVHGLSIESATLPQGWRRQTVPVEGRGVAPATGWCLEGHDLAASKLVAYREKDRRFVRTLIVEGLIEAKTLLERLDSLPVEDDVRAKLADWVRTTANR